MNLGKAAILFGLAASIATVVLYLLALRGSRRVLKAARIGFALTSAAGLFSFFWLMWLCYSARFEYDYVYRVVSVADPQTGMGDLKWQFRIAATWAQQQGSFLLWVFMTCLIGGVMVWKAGRWEARVMPLFVSTLCFLFAILVWLSPFDVIPRGNGPNDYPLNLPWPPPNGMGLNPSLQNYWMAIHPPVIFFGFASLAVPFCFAMAAMIWKDYESWARRVMPYALLSAATLGLGLFMGGYWAYETQGWHGFWAWDPVENASLFPWLAILGLVHGLVVQKSRGGMGRTNVFLAILAWNLFVYGTFLTRSGILANFSVHSFANLQGSALILLIVMIGFYGLLGLGLLLMRWKSIPGRPISDKALSRDTAMVAAVTLMVAGCVVVALGTSWPMLSQWTGLKSLGLGFLYKPQGEAAQPIFYNRVGSVLMIPALIVMGMVPFLAWGKTNVDKFLVKVILPWFAAIGVGVLVLLFAWKQAGWGVQATTPTPLVVAIGTLGAFAAFANIGLAIKLLRIRAVTLGGWLAHVGIGLLMLGTVLTNVYEDTVSFRLIEGDEPVKTPFGYALQYAGWTHDGKPQEQIDREWWNFHHGMKIKFIPLKGQDRVARVHGSFFETNGELDEGKSFIAVAPVFKTIQGEMRGEHEDHEDPKTNRWPIILKQFHRDFYVLVADDPKLDVLRVSLKPGETETLPGTDYKVRYKKFFMDGSPGQEGAVMGAELDVITPEGKRYAVRPGSRLTETGMEPQLARIPELDGAVMIMGGIDAGTKQVTAAFNLPGAPPRWVANLAVTNKPWINLVWLGVILMGIGTFVAMVRRALEARKGALIQEAASQGIADAEPAVAAEQSTGGMPVQKSPTRKRRHPRPADARAPGGQ